MTQSDVIRGKLQAALSEISDEVIAKGLLHYARSPFNDDGTIYELWCDDRGGCKDKVWNGECPCTDEDQLGCILRFLHQEYIPFDVSEPRDV